MKNRRLVTIPAFLAIIAVIFISDCSNSSLDGKWETNAANTDIGPVIEFSEKNFTFLDRSGNEVGKGTFFTYANNIELAFASPSGQRTYSYSRPGNNTISINSIQFTRKK